jgi:hypothetical protein
MNEIWKDIPNYEGHYQVSNLGNVKSLKKYKGTNSNILKLCSDKKGYYQVLLSLNNKKETIKVHQLVAMAFLGHIRCGYNLVVNHKDFNIHNNCIYNLEIVTSRENSNKKHIISSSKYVGVTYNKRLKKWNAQIFFKGKLKHLGTFINEEDAKYSYDNYLNEKSLEIN